MDWRDLIAWQTPRAQLVTGPTAQGVGLAVMSAVVATAGTGYVVNDVLEVQGGTGTVTAILIVQSVGGSGDVQSVSIANGGAYTVAPTSPASVVDDSTPAGTGATFTLTTQAGPGGLVQLCGQDPSRIYLMIGVAADGVLAWLSPNVMTGERQGFIIGTQDVVEYPWFEFWLDRHGCLAQLGWYAWLSGDASPMSVITVAQERDPCQWTTTGQMMPPKPRSLPRGRSIFSPFGLRRNRSPAVQGNLHNVDLHKRVQRPSNPDTA